MRFNVKDLYPWRVGVTSFVMPDDIVSNVRFVADKVDSVQLLFFESSCNALLHNPVAIPVLQQVADESGLAYTVHLPTDIRLGASDKLLRRQGLDEIERLINELAPINPVCFDLHLQQEKNIEEDEWQDNLDNSLTCLAKKLGDATRRITIENIDYPIETILPLLQQHDFSQCLDMGHILLYGHDEQIAVDTVLPNALHIHYHGVHNGKDHQALREEQLPVSRAIGQLLSARHFSGVFTLELYSMDTVEMSLDILKKAWEGFERRGGQQ
jgi:sugar phosphate isomerase/epimerase